MLLMKMTTEIERNRWLSRSVCEERTKKDIKDSNTKWQ